MRLLGETLDSGHDVLIDFEKGGYIVSSPFPIKERDKIVVTVKTASQHRAVERRIPVRAWFGRPLHERIRNTIIALVRELEAPMQNSRPDKLDVAAHRAVYDSPNIEHPHGYREPPLIFRASEEPPSE